MNAEEVYQCGKCGSCLASCPVYLQLRDETASPRAKVQLIKHYAEQDLSSSGNLSDVVNRCLMCGSCTNSCPSGVRHDSLFMRMRTNMVADHGENWRMRIMYHLLSHEEQLRLAAGFVKFGRSVVFRSLAREINVGDIPMTRLPKFNAIPFRDRMPSRVEPDQEPAGTVVYFTGCATNYVRERVGYAVVKVLAKMGFRIEIPKGQKCCGLPMFFHGNLEGARKNILENVRLLNRSDVAAVVVDCATCGSALRREYGNVLKELSLDTNAANALGEKVRDISEFILENYNLLEPHLDGRRTKINVTYHSPCHLRNLQGVKTEVEELLLRLPHVNYTRASDFDTCCGGGGSFFYEHPEIARKIVGRKIDNAKATGAEFWATGCPGCDVHLSGNLADGDGITVCHPVQLIEMGMAAPT